MSEPVIKAVLKKEKEDRREEDIIEEVEEEETEDSSEDDIDPEVIKKIKEMPIVKLKPRLVKIHRSTVIRKRPANYSGFDTQSVVTYTPRPTVGIPSTSGVSFNTPKSPYFTNARGLPREYTMPCPNVVYKPEMNEDSVRINTTGAGRT
ncbi:unnamed protein product [Timema podura]|uniref:Uncharacterized protein n=1 Tax=Timema podura TaxID=61482 RepID=A0ABN7PHN2_TIMPD|nr:unnamed protein product [Timema podura]